MIVRDVESMNISLDNFTRTTDDLHYEIAQNFFLELYNKGLIYKRIFSSCTVKSVISFYLTVMLKVYVLFADLKHAVTIVKNAEGLWNLLNLMNLNV